MPGASSHRGRGIDLVDSLADVSEVVPGDGGASVGLVHHRLRGPRTDHSSMALRQLRPDHHTMGATPTGRIARSAAPTPVVAVAVFMILNQLATARRS